MATQALPQLRPAPGARGRRPLPGARHRLPARRDPQRPVPAAVRRDHAREPAPQARPGPLGHAPRRRHRPAAGGDGLRRPALQGGVHRRPGRWRGSAASTRYATEQAGGLRLRLRLNDAPAIAGLPWELLYDARTNNFLAQSERTPLVRFLDVPQVPRPIAVDGPLRVLAIISSPIDLEELDVEAEWAPDPGGPRAPRIDAGLVVARPAAERDPRRARAPGCAGIADARHPLHRPRRLRRPALREGVIYFQDQARAAQPRSPRRCSGPYLRDHDPLRMVVLNACRSARTDAVDPFGGMAQGLVQQDATAVVAMQFPISDRAAVTFTGEFYGALVDGLPVDQAVSSARKSLLAGFQDEWATPGAVPALPRRQHLRERARRAGRRTRPSPTRYVPDPPGPSFWKSAARWFGGHRPLVLGVAGAGRRARGRAWSSSCSCGDDDVPVTGVALPDAAAAGGCWRQLRGPARLPVRRDHRRGGPEAR